METKKIRIRANIKGQLTRYGSFVSENIKGDVDYRMVASRFEGFKLLISKFDMIQTEIEGLASETDADAKEQALERIKFEDEFYNVERQFLTLLDLTLANFKNEHKRSDAEVTLPDRVQRVRLPQIELPSFDGKLTEYRSFREVFESLIHKNETIHEVDKLLYLRASLKGEALRIIESLPTTAESYKQALTLLKDRYDNVRCLKNAHFADLFGLPAVERNSSKSLRNVMDIVTKTTMSLAAMGEEIKYWDSILVFQVTSKFDNETRRLFENKFGSNQEPKFKHLKEFVDDRCATLERLESEAMLKSKPVLNPTIKTKCFVSGFDGSCCLCGAIHSLWKCQKFGRMNVLQRREKAKALKLCFKCLQSSHFARDCTANDCSRCHQRHHDILHVDRPGGAFGNTSNSEPVSLTLTNAPFRAVLLFTISVLIKDSQGIQIPVRALLDSGSQVNFISINLLRRLKLAPKQIKSSVDGIGGKSCQLKYHVEIDLMSHRRDFSLSVGAYVIEKITSNLPQRPITDVEIDNFTKGYCLADPDFHRPGPVEILLSNEVFVQIMKTGVRTGARNVKMINTDFGWIVGGSVSSNPYGTKPVACLAGLGQCDFDLSKFWELEEIPKEAADVDATEQVFGSAYCRDDDGRFIVKLPFSGCAPGDCRYSKSFAVHRFRLLERRFERCPDFRKEYDAFMSEYLKKGFIEAVEPHEENLKSAYYLPHHGVIKRDSLTTKLRVVFSGKDTSAGCSAINQLLETGPKLQNDLVQSLLRFHIHPVAFAADIEKMYCQILIAKEHRNYLRFFYRFSDETGIGEYRLRCLPFGLNCSPYIAIRCLRELGFLNREKYRIASRIILEDTYVDDVLSGAENPSNARKVCRELVDICAQGGFSLRKWKTNSKILLSDLDRLYERGSKDFVVDSSVSKVLGMKWNSEKDILAYSIESEFSGPCTKRTILSWIAGLFDPLGLLGPILIIGKVLIQRLWIFKLDWDDSIPTELNDLWTRWTREFIMLKKFYVDRVAMLNNETKVLAFADASEKAYGCAIYFMNNDRAQLVFAKSRVAPVKVISLARLELCAAVLCSRAVSYVLKCFQIDAERCMLFSDSEIVLAWISKPAYSWRTFVANRVSEIQNLLPGNSWHHVRSEDNPADLISRGAFPSELISNKIWWNGPNELGKVEKSKRFGDFSTELESKGREFVGVGTVHDADRSGGNEVLSFLLNKFSKIDRIKRIYAWVLRFVSNVRSSKSRMKSKILSLGEMDRAFCGMLRFVQCRYFGETMERLKRGKPLKSRDSLLALDPFLDENFVLRVGGRLQHANLSFSQRHPIILPKRNNLTYMIINDEHIRCDHLGAVGLISMLRQRFWIINARSTVRTVLRRCARCFRCHPVRGSQLMGSLPIERTASVHAFASVGIDLCGPFFVRPTLRRGNNTVKCYVALFICMATKAIHLDTVFDLSADSFMATFRRFAGRRGLPKVVMTDNATNFVGMRNRLIEWYDLLGSPEFQNKVSENLLKDRIEWKFIPPRSPNFGGLWESHIKSFKTLFLKCTGETRLTIEEFSTLLAQVEATLNSRPICGITESIDDLDCLTPGHFLIGRPLKMLPCPSSHDFGGSLSKRWLFVQQLFHDFWKRWSAEYVLSLQYRVKNKERCSNICVGDIGLVVDDACPPLHWKLGRVMEVLPGKDRLTRVIVIKTVSGVVKRGIKGFCRFDFASE